LTEKHFTYPVTTRVVASPLPAKRIANAKMKTISIMKTCNRRVAVNVGID
jgi:hypothetical protein